MTIDRSDELAELYTEDSPDGAEVLDVCTQYLTDTSCYLTGMHRRR